MPARASIPSALTLAAFHALLACLIAAPPCDAASPSLGGISPVGLQRGSEAEVLFNGSRLSDAQEILFYDEGVRVVHFEIGSDSQVKTRLAVAPDCPLGIHAVRVRTATRVSNLRTSSVGPFKEVAEAEPNSDFAQPQKIELNVTVSGVVQNEDVDYFAVAAAAGQRITAEVEGIRLGIAFFDPYPAILDSGRFELSAADDTALVFQDSMASIIAPKDGTYIVQVRESSYGGSGACLYRLHVGTFPRPTAALPAGGKPGQTLGVRFLCDVAGEITQQVTLPAAASRWFGLVPQDAQGISPSPVPFRLSELDNLLEAEPNAVLAQANAFQAPQVLNGVIGSAGDTDFYKFAAKAGQAYDIRVFALGLRSPLDPVLIVYRGDGAGLASNDDSGGPDAYLRFVAPADGEYALSVRDHLGKGGPHFVYRVELTPVKPALTLTLPEVQRNVDVALAVPRGNRMAVMVNASRADFGGDLQLQVQNLPPGLTLEAPLMAANQSSVPLLLAATPDAPLAGRLCDLLGWHADPNTGIAGRLTQTTQLVIGDNNNLVWGYTADRLAVVLSEEAPFRIDIEQPKIPLVRGGSMVLKVVATRKEGFSAPINLRMLYNPGGVGSSTSVTIPDGQNEAHFMLNAGGDAELRTWKIAVIGQATVGNGPIEVATQLAELQVAERFFNFAFQNAAVEQGQETEVVVSVTHQAPFEGSARVELLGLPHEATTQPLELTTDQKELVFKVKTTANSPVGKHRTLFCRATLLSQGEPIVHYLGTGELRIDQPLPPKPMAVAAAPPPMPPPMPEQKPPERRLTRLEKLRLEREAAKKNEAPAPAATPPALAPQPADQPKP